MRYQVDKLQIQFQGLMPLLDKNLEAKRQAKEKQNITPADYQFVRLRHARAKIVSEADNISELSITPEELFIGGQTVFIDLRDMIKRSSGEDRLEVQTKHDELLELYKNNGFVGRHDRYDFPTKPVKQFHEEFVY